MKKRILTILLAGIISCTAFVGCGDSKEDKTSGNNTKSSDSGDVSLSGADVGGSSGVEATGYSEYKDLIDSFINGVNQDDSRLYETAFHTDEQLELVFELFASHGETDFEEKYYESIGETISNAKSYLAEEGCGDNIQYSFETSEETQVPSGELEEYEDSYNANLGSYLPRVTVEDAYVIDGIMTAKGDSGEYSNEFVFIAVKIDGGSWILHPYTSSVDFMD